MFSYYGDNPSLQIVCQKINNDSANNNVSLYNSDTFYGTPMSKLHGERWLVFEWKYY